MSTDKNNGLQIYTSDLLALEKHFMNAIRKQKASDKVTDERAVELLHELDKMASKHVQALEKHVDRLGGDMKADIKTTVASFAGSIAGLIDSVRNDTMLTELTAEHMTDCTALITEISKVVPIVVAAELIDDKDRAETIGQQALENTQAAWNPEVFNRKPEIV